MGASFLWRKASTWGQILLVSVPEKVWSTPLHLEGKSSLLKGQFTQTNLTVCQVISAEPGGTGSTPGPALSGFHRTSASVWPCLESRRLSGPEAPRWRHPVPAEDAASLAPVFEGFSSCEWLWADRRRRTHRDLRRVEIHVVNSAAGKVSPARRQPLFDGLEGDVQVDDRVCAVGVLQGLRLGHRPRETWWTDAQMWQNQIICQLRELQGRFHTQN